MPVKQQLPECNPSSMSRAEAASPCVSDPNREGIFWQRQGWLYTEVGVTELVKTISWKQIWTRILPVWVLTVLLNYFSAVFCWLTLHPLLVVFLSFKRVLIMQSLVNYTKWVNNKTALYNWQWLLQEESNPLCLYVVTLLTISTITVNFLVCLQSCKWLGK